MISHRIDRRDAEAITNGAVGCAAASLHHDVVFAAKIYDVPDDQKISWEPELANERKFFLKLPFHLGADRGVTLLRTEPDDRAQKRIHRVTGRDRIFRKFIAQIFERKGESLGEMRCVFDRFR